MTAERTVPVRISAETAQSLKMVAAFQGRTPAAVMSDAWRMWVREHQDEIRAEEERNDDRG